MKIRLLSESYLKTSKVREDFVNNDIKKEINYSDIEVDISLDKPVPFPIYYADDKNRKKLMIEAFLVIREYYQNLNQDFLMNGTFWQTFILTELREYIIVNYSKVIKSERGFRNLVQKKFDWENYIYKTILLTQYIVDNVEKENHLKYVELVSDNMDVFNYCIKYRLFRNDKFIIMVLNLIDEKGLSKELKATVKHLSIGKKDERFGRRVILELNKRYPISMIHMVSQEKFENTFLDIFNRIIEKEKAFIEKQ